MSPIAIKQGRLSPPPSDRTQAFPWDCWQQEFNDARDLGFDAIEWMLEAERWDENPLMTQEGVRAIRRRIAQTSVRVLSVCADYFIRHPFFRVSEDERQRSVEVLSNLIAQSSAIGATTILLPVLEFSEVRTEQERDLLLQSLDRPLEIAAAQGVRLGLETELPYAAYRALVVLRPHPNLGVYYDVGNATAAGYDASADLAGFASHLVGVHLKDRRRGGPTVPLGEGGTDYPAVFETLARLGYQGQLVLEAASGPDYLGDARRNFAFVRTHLAKAS